MTQLDLRSFLSAGSLLTSSPGILLVGWGDLSFHSSPPSGMRSFYFPDFFLQERLPWVTYSHNEEIFYADLKNLLFSNEKPPPLHFVSRHREIFESVFADLKRQFKEGSLKKAVPYIFERALTSFTPDLLRALLGSALTYVSTSPTFLYGTWGSNGGILGATPEALFELEGNTLTTAALAGTADILKSDKQLLQDPKERREHQIVVDGIVESLSPFGKVSIGETHVLQLPTLKHLKTSLPLQLSGSFKGPELWGKLVHALHPTPALGTFPKEEGREWLREFDQKIRRGRFGAPAGFWDDVSGRGCCYVSIRNAQWDKEQISLYAGCGVVPESELEKEWAELQLKLNAIKALFAV